jgi:polysaccharide biosynthesis transport protein
LYRPAGAGCQSRNYTARVDLTRPAAGRSSGCGDGHPALRRARIRKRRPRLLYIGWQGAILSSGWWAGSFGPAASCTCGSVATVNRHVSPTDGTIVPSLLDYLRVLGRRKFLFLLIVILVPATAVAVSLTQEPTYRASAVVYLQSQSLGTSYTDPERVAQTQAELARSPAVVDPVLDAVPSADLNREEFLESSSVSATLGRDILTFSVEHSDPQLARRLTTEYADSYSEYQERLDTEALTNTLEEIRQRIAEAEANGEGTGSANYDALVRQEENLAAALAAASQTRSTRVVTPAGEAPKVSPRPLRNGLIAFCLGLVLALVVVFLVDALDTRVRSVDTIRETLGLRLLGRLSKPPSRLRKRNGLVMLADPTSTDAEQFRALRWSLDLANAEHGARTIMITSSVDSEGKSTTVANLAVALARAGRRVVLVDADLSHPQLHRLFDIDQQPGLTDVEMEETWLVEALQPVGLTEDSSEDNGSSRLMDHAGSLEVLPAGSAVQDPDELGFDRAVGRIIQRVRGRADVVLVDGPPALSGHAIALSTHVDGVVVVVRLKAVKTAALEELGWLLEASPAVKLGFVVTGDDKTEGYYGQQKRPSKGRQAPKPRPKLPVSASAADGDGDAPELRRAEIQAGEGSIETSDGDESEPGAAVDGGSKPAGRPFGGLTPREAAQRSAESRRAKSAQRTQSSQRDRHEEAHDPIDDA